MKKLETYGPIVLAAIAFTVLLLALAPIRPTFHYDTIIFPTPTPVTATPTPTPIVSIEKYWFENYGLKITVPKSWEAYPTGYNEEKTDLSIWKVRELNEYEKEHGHIPEFTITFLEDSAELSDIKSFKLNNETKKITRQKINGLDAYYVDVCGYDCHVAIYLERNNQLFLISLGYTENQSKISPEIRQIISSIKFFPDTSTWKTYKNSQYGFEFKYPSNFVFTPGKNTERFNLNFWKSIGEYNKSKVARYPNHVDTYFNLVVDEITDNRKKERFDCGPVIFNKSLEFNKCNYGVVGGDMSEYSIETNKNRVVLETMIDDLHKKDEIFNQILSTFKFTDQKSATKYTCPKGEWVDCMPSPDSSVQKTQCLPDYLNWATENCPNFKGAAL